MRVAIIGRTKILYDTAIKLVDQGHDIKLIVSSKEAPEYTIKAKDFENLASSIGAKYLYTPKINEDEIITTMGETGQIDIAISINYTGVIGQKVIDLFPLGILNAHGGDLPKYRGNACQAWAIINAEDRIGLCIHKMIGGELDSGDILEREFYPINMNTRVGEVYEWMTERTPVMMLNSVNRLLNDPSSKLETQSKNPADALRCYPRLPEDGRINWNLPAEDIVRLINASSEPFSGAFSFLKNEKVVIWRAELVQDNEVWSGISGQVSKIDKVGNCVEVLTGSGKIRIFEIQLGEERGAPTNFIKSIRLRFSS